MSTLKKQDLYTILETLLRCTTVDNQKDINTMLDGIRETFPFEQAVLTLIEGSVEGAQLRHYINHSYSQEWINCYMSNYFYRNDPVLKYSIYNNKPFLWREIDQADNHYDTNLFDLAYDYGLEDGVSYAYGNGKDGSKKTLISIAGTKKCIYQIRDRICVMVTLLLPLIHDVNLRVFYQHKTNLGYVNLSGRERDVIAWTADGKSVEEIGRILSISEDTVKYHMKNLNDKLNTVNKYHAVSTALRLGII
jgi:DNA-binding CsgD family transcriptional regulator